jgi:tRNA (guanine37-N1)-methyltransferase
MRIDILTLFPGMFDILSGTGIFQRAVAEGLVDIGIHNIRDYSHDKHHVVDDYPYGGGAGMLLKPEPIFEAVKAVKEAVQPPQDTPIILLTPQGRPFHQTDAHRLAQHSNLILLCGHYEGVDERVRQHLVTEEISIGDYVLTGGELAAMVVTDAVVRLIPGVLGSQDSPQDDSHSDGLLEYPQYTRPADYRGWPVPEILLSGNHAQIARWRRQQALARTLQRRPDLLQTAELDAKDIQYIEELKSRPDEAE